MKRKTTAQRKKVPAALVALRRAARKAVELARRTRTPAWVLENGQLVDAAHPGSRKRICGSSSCPPPSVTIKTTRVRIAPRRNARALGGC